MNQLQDIFMAPLTYLILIELRFYVPPHRQKLITETFFRANL